MVPFWGTDHGGKIECKPLNWEFFLAKSVFYHFKGTAVSSIPDMCKCFTYGIGNGQREFFYERIFLSCRTTGLQIEFD